MPSWCWLLVRGTIKYISTCNKVTLVKEKNKPGKGRERREECAFK